MKLDASTKQERPEMLFELGIILLELGNFSFTIYYFTLTNPVIVLSSFCCIVWVISLFPTYFAE